jgi:Zn-dependent protease with chaperone function
MAIFRAQDFMHPLDRAAKENLEQIPGLRQITDKFLRSIDERAVRQYLMASALRLGPRQLPDIYRMLPPICEAFGIEEPELYLTHGDVNAWTFGQTRTCIVLYSGLIEHLEPAEIEAVLAHECGHILCQHVLYRSMALVLERATGFTKIGSLMTAPIQSALLAWIRKSELTADRAAAGYLGGSEEMTRALLRFAGVLRWAATDQYSLDEFATQAAEFESMMDNRWEKLLHWWRGGGNSTHPLLALRVRELQRWCASQQFAAIGTLTAELRGGPRCVRCGAPARAGALHCSRCGLRLEPDRLTAG